LQHRSARHASPNSFEGSRPGTLPVHVVMTEAALIELHSSVWIALRNAQT
jgi:hypothetical protein